MGVNPEIVLSVLSVYPHVVSPVNQIVVSVQMVHGHHVALDVGKRSVHVLITEEALTPCGGVIPVIFVTVSVMGVTVVILSPVSAPSVITQKDVYGAILKIDGLIPLWKIVMILLNHVIVILKVRALLRRLALPAWNVSKEVVKIQIVFIVNALRSANQSGGIVNVMKTLVRIQRIPNVLEAPPSCVMIIIQMIQFTIVLVH